MNNSITGACGFDTEGGYAHSADEMGFKLGSGRQIGENLRGTTNKLRLDWFNHGSAAADYYGHVAQRYDIAVELHEEETDTTTVERLFSMSAGSKEDQLSP